MTTRWFLAYFYILLAFFREAYLARLSLQSQTVRAALILQLCLHYWFYSSRLEFCFFAKSCFPFSLYWSPVHPMSKASVLMTLSINARLFCVMHAFKRTRQAKAIWYIPPFSFLVIFRTPSRSSLRLHALNLFHAKVPSMRFPKRQTVALRSESSARQHD